MDAENLKTLKPHRNCGDCPYTTHRFYSIASDPRAPPCRPPRPGCILQPHCYSMHREEEDPPLHAQKLKPATAATKTYRTSLRTTRRLSQLLSWSGYRGCMERDDIKERRRQHVQVLMTSNSNKNIINTFSLFPKLFKELRCKTVTINKDECQFLARTENPNVGQMGVLAGVPDCPYVWCDFASSKIPGSPRKLEIQENVENYVNKKDSTMKTLDDLKAHQKLLSLSEQKNGSNNLESDQVDLCRFMYKLNIQQLQQAPPPAAVASTTSASPYATASSTPYAARRNISGLQLQQRRWTTASMVLHPTPPPSCDAAPTDVTPSQSTTPPPDAPTPPPGEMTPPPGDITHQVSMTPPPSCGTTPRYTPPPPFMVPEITPTVVEEVEEEARDVENAETSLPDNSPEAQTLLLKHVNEPSLGNTDGSRGRRSRKGGDEQGNTSKGHRPPRETVQGQQVHLLWLLQ